MLKDLWIITIENRDGSIGKGWSIWQFPPDTPQNSVEQCYSMARPEADIISVEFLGKEDVED